MLQDHKSNCSMCDCLLSFTSQKTVELLQVDVLKQLAMLQHIQKFSCFETNVVSLTLQKLTLTAYVGDTATPHEAEMWANHVLLQKCVVTQEPAQFFNNQTWVYLIPVKHDDNTADIWIVEFSRQIHLKNITPMVDAYKNCKTHISLHNYDTLTGLQNRRAYNERIERMMHKKRRNSDGTVHIVTLCVLDIDFFKRINDGFGHLYGDEVLLLFSKLMTATFREKDLLYRYGGEEFIALLTTNSEEEVEIALERFRAAVENYAFPQVGYITVSIGFVSMNDTTLPSSLFDQADKALYYAKENGRNQIRSFQKLVSEGLISQGRTDASTLELF